MLHCGQLIHGVRGINIFCLFPLENSSGQGSAICTVDWRPQQSFRTFLPTLSTPEQVEDETIGEKEDGGKSRGEKEKSRKKNQQQSGLNRATNDFYSVDYPSFYFCPSTY